MCIVHEYRGVEFFLAPVFDIHEIYRDQHLEVMAEAVSLARFAHVCSFLGVS